MQRTLLVGLVGGLGVLSLSLTGSAQQPPGPSPAPMTATTPSGGAPAAAAPTSEFDRLTRGAKEYEGLFRLFHKDNSVYMEIGPGQYERNLLLPISIARAPMGAGGYTLNFEEQWVVYFKKVGDRIHLVRRNVRHQVKGGGPIARAVETSYTDSVLQALRVVTKTNRGGDLIDVGDLFMRDFAQVGIGMMDPSRSSWNKVKAFKKNVEFYVNATFSMGGFFGGRRLGGDDSIIDPRGFTVVMHYAFVELPSGGYQPRLADDRVGHFLSAVKDFSSDNRDSPFYRYVNRWDVQRADSNPNRLSPPRKKIVYWVDKSVPEEYRGYVRDGILEWNKAFEKLGLRDVIEVRQQRDEDEFDPEDINYATFRWVATGRGFAMGPSRANPLTGEILDADIIFDADMVRHWKAEYRILTDGTGANAVEEEPASLIKWTREGGWLRSPQLLLGQDPSQGGGWDDRRARLRALQQGACQCGPCMKYELNLAATTLAARGDLKPGEKAPEELIGQAIKHVVMHEVGHTLGLRHNFKASTMLKPGQLHDTAVTRKQGLVGSVMDYSPVNLAPKGVKQGDYFSQVLGPYDYWAIEYAYKPLSGGTEGELDKLKEIAAKGAAAGLDYGTDEDMMASPDPLTNVWDLGADPMQYARLRIELAEELLKNLAESSVEKGEGYQRTRDNFTILLGQIGNGAHLVANFIGGEHLHRDHKGDPNGRDPQVPVKAAKQREALKFLQEHLLTDRPFKFSPELLRKLAAERWMHWGADGAVSSVEYPVHQRILAIQRIALDQTLNPGVLTRIQNNALKADKDEEPLTLAEVFRSLTDGIWNEVGSRPAEVKRGNGTSAIRRNLQREHLRQLSGLVLGRRASPFGGFDSIVMIMGGGGGANVPADARSLARLHLRDVQKRIEATLKDAGTAHDDLTRAHLEECQDRIAKVLNASLQIND